MVDMVFLLPVGQVAPIAALTAIGQATAGRPHLRPQRSGGPASDKNLSARRRHAGDIVGASGCGHEPEATPRRRPRSAGKEGPQGSKWRMDTGAASLGPIRLQQDVGSRHVVTVPNRNSRVKRGLLAATNWARHRPAVSTWRSELVLHSRSRPAKTAMAT